MPAIGIMICPFYSILDVITLYFLLSHQSFKMLHNVVHFPLKMLDNVVHQPLKMLHYVVQKPFVSMEQHNTVIPVKPTISSTKNQNNSQLNYLIISQMTYLLILSICLNMKSKSLALV